ncbi:hypothetical protein [Methylomonas sp. TEB]|uniref:hypothetical protein n=1 Tax=Methylomonas sp. TEB TaxID=3398229 RepID=UPI0039F56109
MNSFKPLVLGAPRSGFALLASVVIHFCRYLIAMPASAKEAGVDLGYPGVEVPVVTIYKARQKRGVDTRRLKGALKRRNAIEPIIGHLQNDGLMGRNYLKGEMGDALRAILCGAGHNIRLILRRLRIFWRHFGQSLFRLRGTFSSEQFLSFV